MTTIACAHELCAAGHHEATPEPIQHQRVITDEGAPFRVTATWTGNDHATGRVELTYDETSVTLTMREAAFWVRIITIGGSWTSTVGPSSDTVATDLGAAAVVLHYLDPDGEQPEFGSWHLSRCISDIIAGFFDDEDEGVHA